MNMMASLFFFLCFLLGTNIAAAKRDTYIIHMDSSAMPKAFSSHHGWYTSIVASILDDDRVSKHHSDLIIYSYTNAIHDFSATLSPSELASIKKSPSFLSATRDTKLKLATTHSSDFLGLNSLSGAWPTSDFGRDVIIGVVDSGITESKSFFDEGMGKVPQRWKGGCYGGVDFNNTLCNKKLIGVRFFNKGLKAQNPNITIVDSARDDVGHGTHVSSIAAGNFVHGASYFGYVSGTAKGMAPRARLALYKVASTIDDISASDIIAAIDVAIEDKIDILSLSIAPSPPIYHDPVAIATFAAMENGIFISCAAGNLDPFNKIIPNGAPWLLTVAAGTTDRTFSGTVLLGNGAYLSGSSFYPLHAIPANLPITHWKSCNQGEAGLSNSEEKIVVCVITDPDFDVSTFPSLQGAAGAVLIWNTSTASYYLPDLPNDVSSFPIVLVSSGTGKVIMDYINDNHEPTATLWFKEAHHGTRPAPKVAHFSLRGPSPTCPFILKPDILAPGHHILASWQERKPIILNKNVNLISKFRVVSGTSMATPHTAGVAALLRGAHPDWSPAAIRSAIMTTADPLDNLLSPIQEQGSKRIASPLAIGAGHISPNKALEPGLVYDAHVDDYVNLLCTMNLTSKQIHAITRSRRSCSKPSLDLNYPSFIAYFNCNGTKSVQFKRTLTNVGDDKSTYYAELAPIEGFKVSVMPKKLVFKKKLQKQRYELRIDGPCLEEETIVHGSITWLKVGGKTCSVRSPIVVTGLNSYNVLVDHGY